ncbi:TetR/AcrR family transcriptional regulator [Halomonas sp. NO4]|uniref:TetR/AcrR family transcriptional regulator n=1 Tax=Halomonas sp. NO4 TaxID=2484813 RepID=UPI001969FF7B|nr:TetR/AcrR family transcriptional regulator [Halomonas sp. NO4]
MMRGRGEATRERILAIAESAVLAKGFGATSIEELIAEAGITKSGFFYHFHDKNALARALLERYMEREDVLLDDVFARGRELAGDPLHGFLAGLKLLAETMSDLPGDYPGCLVATYCYQERLFDRGVRELNRRIVLHWRARFSAILAEIAEHHAPREPVDTQALADMVSTIIEGGLVLGRATRDPQLLPTQLMLLRHYVQLLFEPPAETLH